MFLQLLQGKISDENCEKMQLALDTKYPPNSQIWRDKLQQLAYNLLENHEYLLSTYRPSDIVNLNDEGLIVNIQNALREKQNEKTSAYNLLLETTFGDEECRTVTCRVCGVASKVDWEIKQTRSADEGSTIFCVCNKCKTRWKM